MTTKRIDKQTVTLAEAMALTGWTKQNLQRLIDAGLLKRKERATFELGNLFEAVMAHLRRGARKQNSPATIQLIEAKTAEVRLRTARAAREVILMEEHVGIVDTQAGDMIAMLNGLASRITLHQNLPSQFRTDRSLRATMRKLIDSIIDEERTRLAERWAKMAEACASGADIDDTADDDDNSARRTTNE